jgi:hypothetical protein
MLEKKQCRATVSRAGEFHAGRCQKPASLEYEGRWFCKTHYPPNALKRREEWDAKFRCGNGEAKEGATARQ